MPRDLDPGVGAAIGLDELISALDAAPFDVRDEDSFASLGPLLARLGRNPRFLIDLAVEELKTRCADQASANGYGAQVFLLHPPDGRCVLRANFWPAAADPALRASGPGAFFYGLPHDHNFPFLTYGYLGPGYWSDYYEYDAGTVVGVPGEPVALRFLGRDRLHPGRLMLYRPRRDIHVQLPPDAFSVSLNILGADPAQPWMEQFRFDVAAGTIAAGLTTTAAEALVALAAHLDGNGRDLATDFAARHPCARMRVSATAALASAAPSRDAALAIWTRASGDPSAYVAGHARVRLTALDGGRANAP